MSPLTAALSSPGGACHLGTCAGAAAAAARAAARAPASTISGGIARRSFLNTQSILRRLDTQSARPGFANVTYPDGHRPVAVPPGSRRAVMPGTPKKRRSAQKKHFPGSYAERYARGKVLREKCPREAHAKWRPSSRRPDELVQVLAAG